MALKKNLDVTIHEAFLEEILQGNWKYKALYDKFY